MEAVLLALKALGGSGDNKQILERVVKDLKLTDLQINQIHSGSRTELAYRLAWARSNAKKKGLIISNGRNSWSLA